MTVAVPGLLPPSPRVTPVARRRVFVALVLGIGLALTAWGWALTSAGGWTVWEVLLLVCLAANAPWLGLSAATAIIGGAIRLGSRDPSRAVLPALRGLDPAAPVSARTLVAVCVRNEDVDEVLSPLGPLLRDLEDAAPGGRFAVGVLSDTSDPAHAAAEERAVAAFAAAHGAGSVLYRRREDNAGYKAGNVMSFLDAHGGAFEFALMLDADSEMSAATVLRLVRVAQADPRIAILQPTVAGREPPTSFTRVFGLGHRHGSRVWATGQAWWQNEEGPFWGHNALVRIAPFRVHCRLDLLPDGSHILSHDHVEAARLHGAGWSVRVLPEDEGSREAHPPNLRAFLARDLRWAAGNMQYRHLLSDERLSPLGRFQMVQCIAHYALTPLWFGMLPLAALNAATGGGDGTSRWGLAGLLLAGWLATHLPKLLGYAEVLLGRLRDREAEREATPRAMLREAGFTTLFDPLAAFDKTLTVSKLALGLGRGWPANERVARAVPWADAWRLFWPHTLAGVALLALFAAGGWFSLLVSLPFVAGLALAVPFCVLTSRPYAAPRAGASARSGLGPVPSAGTGGGGRARELGTTGLGNAEAA